MPKKKSRSDVKGSTKTAAATVRLCRVGKVSKSKVSLEDHKQVSLAEVTEVANPWTLSSKYNNYLEENRHILIST